MAIDPLPSGEAKRAAVQAMFDRIAPRYDRLNRLFTGGLDQRWRAASVAAIDLGPGDRVLDLACGTGDMAEQAGRRGAQVVGADFALAMLHGAARRDPPGAWVQSDALRLPFGDDSFSALVCGFALRNFAALAPAFAEMARVLEPGGRVALLEVDRPRARAVRRAHSLYFDRVVPFLGGLLSDRDAYRYLPRSTAYLPDTGELLARLAKAGFRELRARHFLLGSAQLLTGVRAGPA
ncbi:MAG: ubiquinone/menaquinone biosynthesis methyltransferase [Myxococcota bacterium]